MPDDFLAIADRLASRCSGDAAFGRDDARQACIEGFLNAGSPTDTGLIVTVMRHELWRQRVEASYLMRVPYSSWKKMAETPVQVKHTGLDVTTLEADGSPATATLEASFDGVEMNLAWRQAMKALTPAEIGVLNWALAGYRSGKRPSGKRFEAYTAARAKLRELLEGS